MSRHALAIVMCMALVPVSVLSAEKLPLADFTPDGPWDCRDRQGTNTGAVVIADVSYAFIKADGRLGGYGELFRITDNFDLPHFAVISGYMKTNCTRSVSGCAGQETTTTTCRAKYS